MWGQGETDLELELCGADGVRDTRDGDTQGGLILFITVISAAAKNYRLVPLRGRRQARLALGQRGALQMPGQGDQHHRHADEWAFLPRCRTGRGIKR